MRSRNLMTSVLALMTAMGAAVTANAQAEDEIFVTGSRVATGTPEDASTPVTVLNRDALGLSGEATLSEIMLSLPGNSASESRPNIFDQNFSAGTAQMNLRGLGLGSTLVLVDGRRSTLSGAFSSDGSTFVDLNTLPSIMVKRVEVLKDGAAAIYGSDAVAGVANMITRDDLDGLELSASYQTTTASAQEDYGFGVAWGKTFDVGNFTIGGNYFKRTPLTAADRDFTAGTGFSVAGQPGNFIIPGAGGSLIPAPGLNPDPACTDSNGFRPGDAGPCRFDYIPFNELVIPEERIQIMANLSLDLGETMELYASGVMARNEVNGQTLPPTLPTAGGFIPTSHPDYPFNTADAPNGVIFIGRPLGANSAPGVKSSENNTDRIVFGLKGDLGANWNWDAALQYSQNQYDQSFPDVRKSRFFAALRGEGGPNNDEWINVFGSAGGNSQAVLDDVVTDHIRNAKTDLFTAEFTAAGPVGIELGGGEVYLAVGGQYRREGIDVEFDADSQNFDLSYIKGGRNYSGNRNIFSAYTEVDLPLSDRAEVQIAARYEDYDLAGSSFDPKIAGRVELSDQFVLRGSASTTFRTPSLHQVFGFQTGLGEFLTAAGPRFNADLTIGRTDLKPETAITTNLGTVFTPTDSLRFTADYWRFDYDDVITKQNAQAIYDGWLAAGAPASQTLSGDVFVDTLNDWATNGRPANAANIFVENGAFAGAVTEFINAGSMKTDGIDFTARYEIETSMGEFDWSTSATWINSYDITDDLGNKIDAKNKRNFRNFARSNQEWTGNTALTWRNNAHRGNVRVNYIGDYNDDGRTTDKIASQFTVDAQYGFTLEKHNLGLTVGVLNLFDNAPSFVNANLGYDTSVHDPRGRVVYARMSKKFE